MSLTPRVFKLCGDTVKGECIPEIHNGGVERFANLKSPDLFLRVTHLHT